MKKDKNIYNCIALYGPKNFTSNIAEWYTFVSHWLTDRGRKIDKVGIIGPGFSGKVEQYNKTKDKLKSMKFDGIKSFEIYSEPRGKTQAVFDWKITADINLDQGIVVFCYDTNIVPDSKIIVEEIILELLHSTDTSYGIFYQREANKGPALYAYGMTSGLGHSYNDMKEGDRIAKWMYIDADERKHSLRDVYQINLLSNRHLDKPVNNITLREWITETKSRGKLEQITDKLWFWRIKTENISGIRKELGKQGSLSCYP